MELPFPERFLHYIWQQQLLDTHQLQTTTGVPIQIEDRGTLNTDAGPDFSFARIRINGTLWAGQVELHKKASDWLVHGHQHDMAYQNTILHVVYEADTPIYYPQNPKMPIPTLELKGRIPPHYLKRYWQLLSPESWVPCAAQLKASKQAAWFEQQKAQLIKERLLQKCAAIEQLLENNQADWAQTLYCLLAKGFGTKQNATAFEALAHSLPLKLLARYKQNLNTLEALLLGQAGFLDTLTEDADAYLLDLQQRYHFLKHKYQLKTLQAASWKFGRLRPANFPTLRLVQLAACIHHSRHLFSKILETNQLKELRQLFEAQASAYWTTHYRLRPSTKVAPKRLGTTTIDLLLINTVVPLLYAFGHYKGEKKWQNRALDLLKQLKAEKNSIVEGWKELGIRAKTALDSQALLQLKRTYCEPQKCLACQFGQQLIGQGTKALPSAN